MSKQQIEIYDFGKVEGRVDTNLGDNYDAWRVPALTLVEFNGIPDWAKWQYLISLGILASSSHNTQPWAFELSEDMGTLGVYLDRSRVLSESDKYGRQACVSVGCAVGSILQSSSRYGVGMSFLESEIGRSDVTPLQGVKPVDRYKHIGNLGIGESVGPESSGDVINSLINRRVERRQHNRALDFPQTFYDRFGEIVGADETVGYKLWRRVNHGGVIGRIAEMQAFADSVVANTPRFSRELADYFLKNDSPNCIGMPGSTFNLTDEQTEEILGGLLDSAKMKADNLAGFSRVGKDGINSAALVGMLTVRDDSPLSWMRVGIRLSAIQTLIEANGGGLAIHAGLAEVNLPNTILKAMGLTLDKPVVLFRAGLRDGGEEERMPHSPRLPLSEVVY